MPGIHITEFGGINPSLSSKLLKSSYAEEATNCDLRTRVLRPWPAPTLIGTVTGNHIDLGVEALYPPNATFSNASIWADPECRDFVLENWEGAAASNYGTPSLPYQNVEQGRVFYWRLNDPKLKFRRISTVLESDAGVTRGPLCSSLVVDGEGMSGGLPFATAYCCTYVDNWGGEGAPGPPLLVNNYINGQRINFVISDGNPSHTLGKVNIYRAISDFSSGEDVANAMDTSWHLVATLQSNPGVYSLSYADTIQQHQIPGDTLISQEFFPPPTGQIAGLCKLEGGWLALVFYDGRVAISQRHQWHAWPGRNIVQMPSNRVADAVAWGNTIIITYYDRKPTWISVTADGTGINTTIRDYRENERAFISDTVDISNERQSNRTLAMTPFGAAYWSQAGVVSLGPEGAMALATKGVLLPNQIGTETLWPVSGDEQTPGYLPVSSIWHRGHYITAMQWTAQRPIYSLIDLPDDVSGNYDNCVLTLLDLNSVIGSVNTGYCLASDHTRVIFVAGTGVYEWRGLDRGARTPITLLPYIWRSKVFVFDYQVSFSACKISIGNSTGLSPTILLGGTGRIRILCNGRVMVDRPITNSPYDGSFKMKTFRLPSSFRGTNWQIELTGTLPIDEVHIATSFEELSEP